MLRSQLGADTFRTAIRRYYAEHRNANASSDDLRRAMEEAAGRDLRWFFQQWLHRNLSPALNGSWSYDAATKMIVIELAQTQAGEAYRLPIEFSVVPDSAGQPPRVVRIELTGMKQRFEVASDRAPRDLLLDPNTAVLMDVPIFVKH
jgi:aminopeptidase N